MALAVDEEVLRFEITVKDAVRVAVRQAFEELLHEALKWKKLRVNFFAVTRSRNYINFY